MNKITMKFSGEDIKEIKRQDKLIHTTKISTREYKLNGYSKRNPYQRDYARILYSAAFRRLQCKMQILGVENSAFFRNRLTHSLEVAQIAKGIRLLIDKCCYGEESKLEDIFLLDAAALAHDIGHPAFGHKGERVLDNLLKPLEMRFEGNAQNYRVLRTLEKKDPEFTGLNLTYRTLLAINKYLVKEQPIKEGKTHIKKFMYTKDYDILEEFRLNNNLSKIRTLDAQIIELADDIAYAVHDLEDALSQRYFTIDEILYEMNVDEQIHGFSKNDYDFATKEMVSIVEKAKKKARRSSSFKNLQEYSQVFRKALTSSLTNYFINDIKLEIISDEEAKEHGTIAGHKELKLDKSRLLCKILTKKIFKGVTRKPNIALYEERGAIVIKSLYKMYTDENINKDGRLLPPDYRPKIKDSEQKDKLYARAAADYIAGMMDTFAIETYENLFATPFSSICISTENYK